MQKGQALILIIVGLLIIAVVAGGAYYLGKSTTPKSSPAPAVTSQIPQPTPIKDASPAPTGAGETVNWKTYTNTNYGFSLKYPDDWDYDEDRDKTLINFDKPENKVSAGNGKSRLAGSVRLDLYNQQDNLDNYIKNTYRTLGSKKEVNVNSLTIQEIHHTSCITNDDCINVVFKTGNNIFDFDSPVWSERYTNLEIIYKMLSTFKLLP